MPLSSSDPAWFLAEIQRLDPKGEIVAIETSGTTHQLRYSDRLRSP
jgi:hypothetical protein